MEVCYESRWLSRRTAGQQEQRVIQLDNWKAPQILRVDDMADDAEHAETDWKAVDEQEESLDADDTVDEAIQKSLGKDCVFFHELREVVQSRCYCTPLATFVERSSYIYWKMVFTYSQGQKGKT